MRNTEVIRTLHDTNETQLISLNIERTLISSFQLKKMLEEGLEYDHIAVNNTRYCVIKQRR